MDCLTVKLTGFPKDCQTVILMATLTGWRTAISTAMPIVILMVILTGWRTVTRLV